MSTTFFINFIYFFIFYAKITNIFKKVGDILKTIDYADLVFIDTEPFNSGSFGKLKRCIYDGNEYVCKTFNYEKYLNGKRRKLNLLSEIEERNIYVPKFWVKKSNNVIRFLAEKTKGKDIDILKLSLLK